jgi:hypothetical protein
VLVTVGDAARWAVDYGLARYVEVVETDKLKAPGTLVRARLVDGASPIAWGYDEAVPVYFDGAVAFDVGVFERDERDRPRPSGRGGPADPDVPQGRPYVAPPERPKPAAGEEGFTLPENLPRFSRAYLPAVADRPRVVLALPKEAGSILLSGMLDGAEEVAGKAVVVDAPRGKGHVVLFAINPMWRSSTQGSYALVTNAVLNWQHLGLRRPPAELPAR